jgi:hypothetical protein
VLATDHIVNVLGAATSVAMEVMVVMVVEVIFVSPAAEQLGENPTLADERALQMQGICY